MIILDILDSMSHYVIIKIIPKPRTIRIIYNKILLRYEAFNNNNNVPFL